ncbi:MAG: histidinol-phosphate transaminase [Myxococcales bacterium]|nr:histidinol-phosphate transaminase [Myxococcales bacterium]
MAQNMNEHTVPSDPQELSTAILDLWVEWVTNNNLQLHPGQIRQLEAAIRTNIAHAYRGQRIPHTPTGIRTLSPYAAGQTIASARKKSGVTEITKLSSNEHAVGPSPQAKDTVSQLLSELHRYPEVQHRDLHEALANHHGLKKNQFFIGNGSNEAIDVLTRIHQPPGAVGVISRSSFSMYRHFLRSNGVLCVEVALNGMQQDRMALLEACRKEGAAFLFLTTPHNPTGEVLSEKALLEVLDEVGPGTMVVVDEAYGEYAEPHPDFSPAQKLLERYDNLVVLRTFSKAFGLAGIRIGYAMSNPSIIQAMDQTRQPFNLNRLALSVAQAALEDVGHLKETVQTNHTERIRLRTEFINLGLQVPDSGANFLLVQLGVPGKTITASLSDKGILVRDLASYGFPDAIRVTIGTPEQNTYVLEEVRAALEVEK